VTSAGFGEDADVDDYALLDAGDGARLERFGPLVTDRPHAGALAPRRDPDRWAAADLRFDRDLGWSRRDGAAIEPWTVRVADLELGLRATEAGQVGLFPEHAATLPWLTEQVRGRLVDHRPEVLHLFASTGLATLALARAGAAVAHVDASRPAVTWARDNAMRNDLAGHPIRWLVEDATAFTAREVRRGRRYDGLVLDPPSYGHGGRGGRSWQIETGLPPLLEFARELLADDGFVLLTAHTESVGPDELGEFLRAAWGRAAGAATSGALTLPSEAGGTLDLGAFVRWDRRA
jgi:23S rRNA (cytosine1962-C5)-methyltransferase